MWIEVTSKVLTSGSRVADFSIVVNYEAIGPLTKTIHFLMGVSIVRSHSVMSEPIASISSVFKNMGKNHIKWFSVWKYAQ